MKATLDPIFSPRTVAVVGASRQRNSIGYALLHNLLVNEFQGALYPVNPHAEVIHSLKCYRTISAIPDPIDLAVILVPRDAVLAAVDECLAHGVRGLVVISAGFAETGASGAALEQQLRDRVRAHGVRLIGPNCMGVINADPQVSLNATFAPEPARPGAIGFVSQSGALGVAILNVAASLGMGLTQFVSMGNKADVSGNDLLEFWEDDPQTRVIAMYLESFGNPRRFTQIAKRVGRKKPILMVKSGRTEAGARAASSHTGALAGLDVTVSAFLDQCGVLRANTIEELFDIALAFDRCPLPTGPRVAIVTNAGGPAIMATDACVNLGLEIATLSAATRAGLASFLPSAASLGNPIDMIASATPEAYRRTMEAVLADPGVDMVMVINVTPLLVDPTEVLAESSRAIRATATPKPVLAVVMASEDFYREIQGQTDIPPVYRFPEPASLAMARLYRYAEWQKRPHDDTPPTFPVDDAWVSSLLDRTASGYLPIADAFQVLTAYGIPVVPWAFAPSDAEIHAAAARLGFPLAVKGMAADLVHKSDLGAVELDLRTPEELAQAVQGIRERLAAAAHKLDGFLLQQMAEGGHEVIFGVSTDPRFGPLLMFGLGGKYVEVIQDVRFAITPLSQREAEDVVRGVRGFALLQGVRGEAPADVDFLIEILLRVAQLASRHPRIRELDLNPFLAAPDRSQAMAVDVRIRVA